MSTLPKRNLFKDHQERNVAILLSGGHYASKAQLQENLNKLRAMTNDKGQRTPLTAGQRDTLARAMAGGPNADPKDIAEAKAKIGIAMGENPKRNLVKDKQAGKEAKSPAKQTPAPKAANDNRKPKARDPKQPNVIQFNGKTFVHKSALGKQQHPAKSPDKTVKQSTPQKRNLMEKPGYIKPNVVTLPSGRTFVRAAQPAQTTKTPEAKSDAPKRNLLANQPTSKKPSTPTRRKGRGRER